MKNVVSISGVVLAVTLSTVGCDRLKPPQPQLQPPPSTSAQGEVQQEGERKAYSDSAQKDLDELRAALAQLRSKAEAANEQVKATMRSELDELERDLGQAQQRLTELKAATAQSWKQLKESFAKSVEKLKEGVEKSRKSAG